MLVLPNMVHSTIVGAADELVILKVMGTEGIDELNGGRIMANQVAPVITSRKGPPLN